MSARLGLAAVALAVVASGAVNAAQYSATSAVGSGNDHSVWIAGGIGGPIGSDFDFDPQVVFDSTAGTLTGKAYSQDVGTAGFDVDFAYGAVPFAPSFKSENGSAPAGDIKYSYMTGGSLTGFGELAGLILGVQAMPFTGPYAVQWGSAGAPVGPNNKNGNFGLAHWFSIVSIDDQCSTSYCEAYRSDIAALSGRQGDVNIDLNSVPLPGGALLLISGLAAALGLRRRNDRAA